MQELLAFSQQRSHMVTGQEERFPCDATRHLKDDRTRRWCYAKPRIHNADSIRIGHCESVLLTDYSGPMRTYKNALLSVGRA